MSSHTRTEHTHAKPAHITEAEGGEDRGRGPAGVVAFPNSHVQVGGLGERERAAGKRRPAAGGNRGGKRAMALWRAATAGLAAVVALSISVTAASASTGLPDNRQYELASGEGRGETFVPKGPLTANTEEPINEVENPMLAAIDGNTVAFAGEPRAQGGTGESSHAFGDEIVSTRNAARGRWEARDVTPATASQAAATAQFEGVSPSLSKLVLQASPASLALLGVGGPRCFVALYSSTEMPEENVFAPLFTETQAEGNCGNPRSEYFQSNLTFAGGNAGTAPDPPYSQLLFQTPAPLAAGSSPSTEGVGDNLYESAGSTYARPVGVLPSGEQDSNAAFGGPPGDATDGPSLDGVIAADGSRVFWTDIASHDLYARDNPLSATAQTIALDQAEQGAPGPSGGGLFLAASSDGSKVFFTDCHRLTRDATAVNDGRCEREVKVPAAAIYENTGGHQLLTGNDLYEYDFNRPMGERLVDITADPNPSDPFGADVQGVLGISEDGSYVYFVASGALASGAQARRCIEPLDELAKREEEAEEGGAPVSVTERQTLEAEQRAESGSDQLNSGRGCNLYVLHRGEPTRFVAVLGPQDDHFTRSGDAGESTRVGTWERDIGERTAEVTLLGGAVVFESAQQLTGYDNSSLLHSEVGQPRQRGIEIFVYEANVAGGRLRCVSCSPVNQAPAPESGGVVGWGTYLPVSMRPTMRRRWISDDGSRVFFDSSQPLVPQDVNERQDVYEWEREGTGGCSHATSVWGGCLYLLSGGEANGRGYFVDSDATGDNVFFVHRGVLGTVGSEQANLYDARVGGGFPTASQGCNSCEAFPSAEPGFAAPPTTTVAASGNLMVTAGTSRPKSKAKRQHGSTRRHGRYVKSKRHPKHKRRNRR